MIIRKKILFKNIKNKTISMILMDERKKNDVMYIRRIYIFEEEKERKTNIYVYVYW